MHLLVREARRRPVRREVLPRPRALPDLLGELALGGLQRRLPLLVELARRDLEQLSRRPPRAAARRATRAHRRAPRSPTAPGWPDDLAVRPPRRRRSGSGPRERSTMLPVLDLLAADPLEASSTAPPASTLPPAERGAEEQLVLVDAAAHRPGGQAGRRGSRRGRPSPRAPRARPGSVSSIPGGNATSAGRSSRLEHGARCGARARGGAGAGRRTTCAAPRSSWPRAPARRARCRAPPGRRGRARWPSRGCPGRARRSPRPSRAR